MIVRDTRPDELAAVCALVERAFGRAPEANLVASLVEDGDAEVSLAAEADHRLLGHILLSRMTAPFSALALAPVSVDVGAQSRGVGAELIGAAIVRAREAGWAAIFVLGAPAYYGRFGFDPALAGGFTSPYASPAFMALALAPPLPTLTGELRHPAAFTELDTHSSRLRRWRELGG